MGETPIERAYSKVQLGIRLRVFEDSEESNSFGYELEWRGKQPLARSAFRLQDVKYIWKPEFLRTCVQAYVVGKLQYGASLYWLRGSKKSIDEARFDYCNAMSACLGLEAPEVVGKSLCLADASISGSNKNYLKLCELLGLPTLRDMAILHARRLLRQWSGYESKCFMLGPENKILGVNSPDGSLLTGLHNLSIEEPNAWNTIPAGPEGAGWKAIWTAVSEESKLLETTLGKKATVLNIMNAFWFECRRRFKVLERVSRSKKRLLLALPKKRPSKNDAEPLPKRYSSESPNFTFRKFVNPTISKKSKRHATEPSEDSRKRAKIFDCSFLPPLRRGRKAAEVCYLCGYSLKPKAPTVILACCKHKQMHAACFKAQNLEGETAHCNQLKHFVKKDRSTKDDTASSWKQLPVDTTKDLYCDLCGESLEMKSTDSEGTTFSKKNHYMVACKAIPGSPLRDYNEDASNRATIARVAALSFVKSVGRVPAVIDPPPPIQFSSSLHSVSCDVYISQKEEPPDVT